MKYSTKNIFLKGFYSSLLGMPISAILNILTLDWIVDVANTYNYFLAAVIIALPFMITSAMRISIIDWVYQKYNIDLNPASIIGKLRKK